VLTGNPSSATWTTVTTTSTGTQNDFAPGLVGNTIVRCNNATLLTITGLAAGYDGQHVKFESIGAGQVDFPHQSASSSAANRQINFATAGQHLARGGQRHRRVRLRRDDRAVAVDVARTGRVDHADLRGRGTTPRRRATWTVDAVAM
jgi:hypothetical protein